MVNQPDSQGSKKAPGFTRYVSKRVVIVAVVIILAIWAFGLIPESSDRDEKPNEGKLATETQQDLSARGGKSLLSMSTPPAETSHQGTQKAETAPNASVESTHTSQHTTMSVSESEHDTAGDSQTSTAEHPPAEEADHNADAAARNEKPHKAEKEVGETLHDAGPEQVHEDLPTGVAFVNATIAPLDFELSDRFWGWRPNDIINLTDNVNNFQLGVLEVTRRTVVPLLDRISRTGTTDAFNPHLENAVNWLMVKATRYWFPSPESKYKESIRELEAYKQDLIMGRGSFFTRTDNLIPLLSSYEELLGSCDENLVKQKNEDGTYVSLFKADDYFFYAKGVAHAMVIVLDAVHHDFVKTIESRHAAELLHHALESCREAADLDPLLITNGDLDGLLANHRANMAAPISHARFYIGQLVKTLST